ncbi:MAG: hypothetical protein Q7R95_06845 [bacterium]|nr:hypothetical protein [bacterium]
MKNPHHRELIGNEYDILPEGLIKLFNMYFLYISNIRAVPLRPLIMNSREIDFRTVIKTAKLSNVDITFIDLLGNPNEWYGLSIIELCKRRKIPVDEEIFLQNMRKYSKLI